MVFKLYKNIIESGVSKASSAEEESKIRYLNYTVFFGTILFIPNVFYELYLKLPYTAVVDVIFIILFCIIFLINAKGKYTTARNLAIISANFVLVAGSYCEGLAAGNYLSYIPLFFVFSVLAKMNDKFIQILFLISVTTICLLVPLLFFPTQSTIQTIPLDVVETMFKSNFFIALLLTIIFSYLTFTISKSKEEQLILAKELAEASAKAKFQFLSNMSHELRTPLNGIIGTTNLLKSEQYIKGQLEHFELLEYSSTHMLNLVNDVLDFSKIESGKIELEQRRFNIETFVKNIYNSFAHQFEEKNLFFKLATEDNINVEVISDDIKLSQILNNLLSNALKFTKHGGVTMSIGLKQIDTDKVTVCFSIKDTGIGIAKEKVDKIFESFIQADIDTTRKYGGTGLGLTISKKLVEVFGSKLQLESEVPTGCNFYFDVSFLKNKEQQIQKETPISSTIQTLKGMRILIAEDNKINMLIARKFLKKWEVDLVEAVNGREAITYCLINDFDLLLLDLEMPEADGYTALMEIRKIKPAIPAIAFTAAAFENIETILIEKGFNDYILKPFSPEDLNKKLFAFKPTNL
jgi:signal transduction histidine kinase/CheY-like chemotaxis protein